MGGWALSRIPPLRSPPTVCAVVWYLACGVVASFGYTVSFDLEEPAYKNPRLALWSASKNGLGWLGLTLARASKNIQASLGWRKNRQC